MQQEHVVALESRPANLEGKGEITIRHLVRNALRMRPDRIVIGEVRGGEALDLLQAMNTGHDGSLSTVHANSPRDVLSRLETMALMAGTELPLRAAREQIAAALQLIVHQARMRDGSRKVTYVTEVQGMAGEVIALQDVFRWEARGVDSDGQAWARSGRRACARRSWKRWRPGVTLPPGLWGWNSRRPCPPFCAAFGAYCSCCPFAATSFVFPRGGTYAALASTGAARTCSRQRLAQVLRPPATDGDGSESGSRTRPPAGRAALGNAACGRHCGGPGLRLRPGEFVLLWLACPLGLGLLGEAA